MSRGPHRISLASIAFSAMRWSELQALPWFKQPRAEATGAAVADAPVEVEEPSPGTIRRTRTAKDTKPKRQPRYQVILWNDEHHTYDYVIVMLLEIFCHPLERGYQIAKEVDTSGRAIVLTTTKEHAELKRDQIHAYGKDALIDGCQGSMSSTIEAVD